MDKIAEQLAQEYADEYNSTHGGIYEPKLIKHYFLKGFNNEPLDDKNYHYWKAWDCGNRNGGHQLFK